MQTAKEINRVDLSFIASQLGEEFNRMSGHGLLIAGGAGFLGYYLIQSGLHWNRLNGDRHPIRITVSTISSAACPLG